MDRRNRNTISLALRHSDGRRRPLVFLPSVSPLLALDPRSTEVAPPTDADGEADGGNNTWSTLLNSNLFHNNSTFSLSLARYSSLDNDNSLVLSVQGLLSSGDSVSGPILMRLHTAHSCLSLAAAQTESQSQLRAARLNKNCAPNDDEAERENDAEGRKASRHSPPPPPPPPPLPALPHVRARAIANARARAQFSPFLSLPSSPLFPFVHVNA